MALQIIQLSHAKYSPNLMFSNN